MISPQPGKRNGHILSLPIHSSVDFIRTCLGPISEICGPRNYLHICIYIYIFVFFHVGPARNGKLVWLAWLSRGLISEQEVADLRFGGAYNTAQGILFLFMYIYIGVLDMSVQMQIYIYIYV